MEPPTDEEEEADAFEAPFSSESSGSPARDVVADEDDDEDVVDDLMVESAAGEAPSSGSSGSPANVVVTADFSVEEDPEEAAAGETALSADESADLRGASENKRRRNIPTTPANKGLREK